MGLYFGNGAAEGTAKDKNLLGGKGANLAEMNLIGLPVPAGFSVTTEVCTYYYENNNFIPPIWMIRFALVFHILKKLWVKNLPIKPILCWFPSAAARVSMPGMMDTVLNLGLNDETVLAIPRRLMMNALLTILTAVLS